MLTAIMVRGLSDDQRDHLLALLPVHEGDTYTPDVLNKVTAAAHSFDEHLSVAVGRRSPTEFALMISTPEATPGRGVLMPPPPPPLLPPSVATAIGGPQRIGAGVMVSKIVSQPPPVYPPLAKAARVQGTIRFDATIGTDGTVRNLQLLSGPPLLVQAAMTSVQQWVYEPTLLNGKPVEVITTIDVTFTLAE
jgi:TonB family protein